MNFFYTHGHLSTGANPLPAALFSDPHYEMTTAPSHGYDRLITPDDPQREATRKNYNDDFFRDLSKAAAQA